MNVSVAMCTFNGEAFLREQLHSILSQSRPPDELIVCDDGSTDRTEEIVQEFAARCSFPVHLSSNEIRLGIAKNFEQAIRNCEGDIIALSDQDDVWHQEKLERIESMMLAAPEVGLVFSNANVVDAQLRPRGYGMWKTVRFGAAERQLMKNGDQLTVLLRRNVVTGATMAFRSSFKSLVLPIPSLPPYLHDEWISLLVASVGSLGLISQRLVDYRQTGSQHLGAHPPLGPGMIYQAAQSNSRARNVELYQARSAWLGALHSRLEQQQAAFPCKPAAMAKICAATQHLKARIDMPNSWWLRAPHVLSELVNLRYHHYSKGMWDAARDLLPQP